MALFYLSDKMHNKIDTQGFLTMVRNQQNYTNVII
jgi:hypothetical protein